jgi:hypothetical protein
MQNKTLQAVKYSGTSIVVGGALASILLFAFPQLEEIREPVMGLVVFATNIILAKLNLLSDE